MAGLRLCTLAREILLLIIALLDLRSITRLARSCRFLSALVRSHPVWRETSKHLVGSCIHRPQLTPNPPIPLDWTLDPSCFPLSHFTRSPSTGSSRDVIGSWCDFATRFLIPHYHYLGWHMCIGDLHGDELILITYDVFSGRLIAEQVKWHNLHSREDHSPFPGQVSMGAASLPPRLSSLLDRNQLRLDPNGIQYTIAPGIASPHQDFTFDIFTPVYSTSPFFSISPFPPHYTYTLTKQCTSEHQPTPPCEQFTFQKPTSVFYTLKSVEFEGPSSTYYKELTPRTKYILRKILEQSEMMQEKGVHCFQLGGIPANQSYVSNPLPQDPRIRYQGGPPHRRVEASDIIVAGRTYHSTETGSISPAVHSSEPFRKYCLLNGPSMYDKSYEARNRASWFNGLWLGSHGSRYHLGRINILQQAPLEIHDINFDQLLQALPTDTIDITWGVSFYEGSPFRSVSLKEALDFDTQVNISHDGGWFPGYAKANNQVLSNNISVQFIRKEHHDDHHNYQQDDDDEENQYLDKFGDIDQIRVKWPLHISSYFKVGFI